jgi:hypothetical protein
MIDDSPIPVRGLTKRGRLAIIVVVGVLLVGGPIVFDVAADRQADDALAGALVVARTAAPGVDNGAVFEAYATTLAAQGPPSATEGLPTLPSAKVVHVDANPSAATITYQVSVWGQNRCLNLERSAFVASAKPVACPFGNR